MPHPIVENRTPFAFEPLFLADEELRPLLVPLVKATFRIRPDSTELALAEEQRPVEMAGEYWGDPESSSYKYEPETAFVKPATDVVFIGDAHPPAAGTTEMQVGFRLGPIKRIARVFGDRVWYKKLGRVLMTAPRPIECVPLIAERAFGGWDRTHDNPRKHRFEARNPAGAGFRAPGGKFREETPLPNLEDPAQPIRNWGDAPRPMLFGFTGPHWEPRRRFAGTYGKAWLERRMPRLPEDFDRRFFNAAPPGMVADGFLRGDEPVSVANASPHGRVSFHLPGLPAPQVRVELVWGKRHEISTRLDTIVVNAAEDLVFLLWRASLPLRSGPLDVRSIEVLPVASALAVPVT